MEQPTKAEIRKEFLNKRNALDPAERARFSSMIRQRVFQHPRWRAAGTILCYVSFGSEVETHTLIQEAIRFKKRVVVPLHDSASSETPLSGLDRFSALGPTHRGVLQVQPEYRQLISPETVELALIPGIVFDRQGGRIGFGGGYFDRLLPNMPKAFRLGILFSTQLSLTSLPLDSFDIRMQSLVMESEVADIVRVLR